jgi:signal transduction histidine kinase
MARRLPLWHNPAMAALLRNQHHWIFGAALAVWLAVGWPFLHELATGTVRRASPVPMQWLVPYGLFGAAVVGATLLRLRTNLRWPLLCVQLAAVAAMTVIFPKDLMSLFLVIIAWQVAMATTPFKTLCWVAFQTLAILALVAQAPDSHLSYIIGLSCVLQLCCVLIAQALRSEERAALALARTNRELRSAQAVIAADVRDAERLRISRELHDAWGHELTALGLQLEIASHVGEPRRVNDHVMQAKGLARELLARVRTVVATLRDAERGDQGTDADPLERRSAEAGPHAAAAALAAGQPGSRRRWIYCIAALAVLVTLSFPVLQAYVTGRTPMSLSWLGSFAVFAAAVLAAMALKPRPRLHWALLGVQVAAVAAMAFIASWAMMSGFLIVVAWQVAMTTGPVRAFGWLALQTSVVVAALALAERPDLCWVIGKSIALQLFFVSAAQAVRREAETARTLARTNRQLQAAQAVIAANAREAERLRISRELHDAWGHQLTALGLQLEIASHVAEAGDHVSQAKGLAHELLTQVRDVVSTLRESERGDLEEALKALAQSIPVPAIHVSIAPGLRLTRDQGHALIRCAQEAVTNAVKHAEAANLWLQVTANGDGVRLFARDDGKTRPAGAKPGSGLIGMRERIESLGGKLAVKAGAGFTIEAWLPARTPQPA